VIAAAAGLVVAGCTARLPTAGIEPGRTSRYASIAVVPLLTDDVRVHYQSGFDSRVGAPAPANWQTREKAGRIVAELLGTTRTTVTTVDVADLPAAEVTASGWARQVWQRLRQANRLGESEVLFVLRENAIDARGGQYLPALDFLVFGVVGLAAGALGRDQQYQPSFQLLTTAGFDAAMGERSRCSIGLDARLLDAGSGGELARVDAVLGQERMPDGFVAQDWAAMDDATRRVAETYCIAALRRAISQAANAVIPTSR
jgi:hypothetical protein